MTALAISVVVAYVLGRYQGRRKLERQFMAIARMNEAHSLAPGQCVAADPQALGRVCIRRAGHDRRPGPGYPHMFMSPNGVDGDRKP